MPLRAQVFVSPVPRNAHVVVFHIIQFVLVDLQFI